MMIEADWGVKTTCLRFPWSRHSPPALFPSAGQGRPANLFEFFVIEIFWEEVVEDFIGLDSWKIFILGLIELIGP